jgi:putative ABC transport system permease protein
MKIHRFLQGSAIDLAQAFRNVLRQKRRVAFALAIVMGGCISLLLAGGFIQWVLDTMRESTIRSQLGHIQIVRTTITRKGSPTLTSISCLLMAARRPRC